MEKKLQNPGVVFALALLCCALWGSAFPCVKIGYEWLAIEGAGSQILFAGYRFFLAGIFTFLIGSFLEKRWLMIRRSSVLPVFGQGMLQTFIQYICFYIGLAHTTGAKGSVINASNAFFVVDICTFYDKIRENDVEEEHRLPDRVCRCDRDQPDTGWNGRWISVDGRRADPGLFHGIWSKFCDIEAALGERNAHCDYSFSAFIRWRNADFGRCFAWRPRAWIYDAVRVAFIVYGTAVHGCIQHMGVAFEV